MIFNLEQSLSRLKYMFIGKKNPSIEFKAITTFFGVLASLKILCKLRAFEQDRLRIFFHVIIFNYFE